MSLYNDLLTKYPRLTKAATAMILYSVSDLASQKLRGNSDVSFENTAKLAAFGGLSSQWFHIYFPLLDRLSESTLVKVAFDQLLVSPCINTWFIVHSAVWDGKLDEVSARLQMLPSIVKAGWVVWLPANFISLRYVPVQYRAIFGNLVAFFWSMFLASKA